MTLDSPLRLEHLADLPPMVSVSFGAGLNRRFRSRFLKFPRLSHYPARLLTDCAGRYADDEEIAIPRIEEEQKGHLGMGMKSAF